MALPFFFVDHLNGSTLVLDEDTSKHMISVLRMQKGEPLLLTDGKGMQARAVISDDNRKKCTVDITTLEQVAAKANKVSIGISLIKNAARFEWFLEKATEIGVREIIPLVCARTEKEKFRHDRLRQILISAMLQSQQCWLPLLHEPQKFPEVVERSGQLQKYIAHCTEGDKQALRGSPQDPSIILIGPEGDFSEQEIAFALQHHFQPVTLGGTRLRTETAGIVAAVLLNS